MTLEEKILSVLSYFHIFIMIPLLWRKKSEVVESHVYNGVLLLLVWSLLIFVVKIPFLGIFLTLIISISALVFSIWGIADAVLGKEAKIPALEKVYQYIK